MPAKSPKAKAAVVKELRIIPGIGPSIANDLWNLGIRSVAQLKSKDPEVLYNTLCRRAGTHIDRCVLYTFRCAVYYASHRTHNPKLLLWWNWKDPVARIRP